MKVAFCLALLVMLLTSCEKEENGLKYYRFQKSDEQWFTEYKKGDTITFISDNAPTRKYVVWEVYDNRKAEWNPSFVDDPKFYYDSRYIELYRIGPPIYKSGGRYTIQVTRFPIINSTEIDKLKTYKSKFTVSVFFDDYNEVGSPPYLHFHDSTKPLYYTSLTINGKVLNEVVPIKSNNLNSFCGNCPNVDPNNNWVQRVNQVYYHKQFGVIKFSDLDGVIWQIKK